MAGMADPQAVQARLEELPDDTAVVSYVNSTTEVKAISDICCTSSNALQVVESLPNQHVLFLPDRNLGCWVAGQTSKTIHIWDGHCYVHDPGIRPASIRDLKQLHPEAAVLVHPECAPPVRNLADFVGSTGAILGYVADSDRESFIIGTEGGILAPLRERNPRKRFFATGSTCASMRLITLHSLRGALDRMETQIQVDEDLAGRARGALEKMVAL
jgi:quinolinate synthase